MRQLFIAAVLILGTIALARGQQVSGNVQVSPGAQFSGVAVAPPAPQITSGPAPNGQVSVAYPGTAAREDLLDWWLMPNPARTTNHMTGDLVKYSWLDADGTKFWMMKGSGGNPWDINLYDINNIYLWITENGDIPGGFNNPNAFKRAITPHPVAPRYFTDGTTVTITTTGPPGASNPGQPTADCDTDGLPMTFLGDIQGVTTGPFNDRDWGGDIGVKSYILVTYYYSGTAGTYKSREQFFLIKGFGWISWTHASLQSGVYIVNQTVTNNSMVSGGAPVPNWPCGTSFPWWVGGTPGAGGNSPGSTSGFMFTATGGTTPYTWTVSSGSLPTGLMLSTAGLLSGTPTVAGTYTPTIRVTGNDGAFSEQPNTITISAAPPPPLQITSPAPLNGTQGENYLFTFAGSGGVPPYQWTRASGAFPVGLTLDLNSGILSGIPTTPGVSNVAVQLQDSVGARLPSPTYSITIAPAVAPTITSNPPPNGTQNSQYVQQFTASGGQIPYTWSNVGDPIPGVTLDTSSGLFSGTPTNVGTYHPSIVVTGSDGAASSPIVYTVIIVVASSGDFSPNCPADDVWTGGLTDGPATLPTHCINTARSSTPSNVATKTVCASGCDYTTVAAAYAASSCGWKINLKATTSGVQTQFNEQLTFNKTCDSAHWITIETDQAASLPEGVRINPSAAGYAQLPGRPNYDSFGAILIPKIIHTTASSTGVVTISGTYHRLIGLEITNPTGDTNLSGLVQITGNHNIVEKLLVHPENTTNGMTTGKLCTSGTTPIACTEEVGIAVTGQYVGIIDPYIYDIRRVNSIAADAKGVFFGNQNPGPVSLKNFFIEASDENIFNGGGACTAVGHDYEILKGQLWKPTFWKKDCTSLSCGIAYDGNNYEVKNLFELKNADRVLFQGFVASHTWIGQGDQDGSAILLTPKNPNGTCAPAQDSNITMRYFEIDGANKGLQIAPVLATQGSTLPAAEFGISIHDFATLDITYPKWTSNPAGSCCNDAIANKVFSQLPSGPLFHDVLIAHGTFIQNSLTANVTGSFMNVTGGATGEQFPNWTVRDNIGTGGFAGFGVNGPGTGQCINSTGNSYDTLGEAPPVCTGSGVNLVCTGGCFDSSAGKAYCVDGNVLMTNQWTGQIANLQLPNPAGNVTSHPSRGCGSPIVGNSSATNYTAVGFNSYAVDGNGSPLSTNNYVLKSSSPYKGLGTQGTDPGANWPLLLQNLTGANPGTIVPDCTNNTAAVYQGFTCNLSEVKLIFGPVWTLGGLLPANVTINRDFTVPGVPDPHTLLVGSTGFTVTAGHTLDIIIPLTVVNGTGMNAWAHQCNVTNDGSITTTQSVVTGSGTVSSSVTCTSAGTQPTSPQQGGVTYVGGTVTGTITIHLSGGTTGSASLKTFGVHYGNGP